MIEDMEGKKAPEGENLSEGLQKTQENPVTIDLEKEEAKNDKMNRDRKRKCVLRACQKRKKTL